VTQTPSTDRFVVHSPSSSMICAGCDGPMVITKDAVGRERVRCPRCQGVAEPRRNPNDAMVPQGLVKATGEPRVIRQIVRVEVPAPPPEPVRIVELPPIKRGQLRCQLCAYGVDPASRFCSECASAGQALIEAAKRKQEENRGARVERTYAPKPCAWRVGESFCGEMFTPTGPRSEYCEPHRKAAKREKEKKARRAGNMEVSR
jgi:hypothetical protein